MEVCAVVEPGLEEASWTQLGPPEPPASGERRRGGGAESKLVAYKRLVYDAPEDYMGDFRLLCQKERQYFPKIRIVPVVALVGSGRDRFAFYHHAPHHWFQDSEQSFFPYTSLSTS